MPSIINTNIASLNAQRNLSTSQSAMSTALQRLSSGLRINSAKDDSAGLAISERMTTQIRGLNQAARNANDGISLAQTGEAALSEITSNLQRIRELAVQSANATNSSTDRATLDQEVQQRLSEIDRIATQTSFNGQKILDGTFGSATFQVGANVGETISIGLSTSMKTSSLGYIAQKTSGEVTTAAFSGSGTIKIGSDSAVTIGASTAGTKAGQSVGSAWAKAAAINSASVPGLTATATNNIELAISDFTATNDTNAYSLKINGVAIYNAEDVGDSGAVLTKAAIADKINNYTSETGVTARLDGSKLYLSAADGRDIAIGQDVTAGNAAIATGTAETVNGVDYLAGTIGTVANATDGSTNATAVNGGTLTLSASQNIVISEFALAGYASSTITKDNVTITSSNVKTVSAANNAINRIDAALTSVSDLRSTFGAIQSRFESTISNLTTAAENVTAARSRIQDADFAQETANLTRAQILQQAGTAMLAQANQLPNTVLSLLK